MEGVAGRGRLPPTTVDSAGAVDEKPDIALHTYMVIPMAKLLAAD